ncbi:MAG: YetF domain-containing protein [Parvularcula sp.]|nr:YetF domain-containing protein [Parvularcula sp.]
MNDKNPIIFDDWSGILEVLVCAPILYALLIISVKVSGKRTAAQMNNFDWIVTVAIGSIIGSGIVSKNVELAEAGFASVLLLTMQGLLTRLCERSDSFENAIKLTPKLLFSNGEFVDANLKNERVTEREILSTIRRGGYASKDSIAWIILENDGQMSIIPKSNSSECDAFVMPEWLRTVGKPLGENQERGWRR